MFKIINSFHSITVLNKGYGIAIKEPFQSIVSYGSSKILYDNNNNNYESSSKSGLHLERICSKEAYDSIKSIFRKDKSKIYINLYEREIDRNMDIMINKFVDKENISDINFHVSIEDDTRVIYKDKSVMKDTVRILTIVSTVSMIKQGEITTKSFKNLCSLEENKDIEKLFMKIKITIDSLLKDKADINLNHKFELIFSPAAAGILIHETLGHALEADLFTENNCFLSEFYNENISSKLLNVDDVPLFRDFDDDGNVCEDVNLIKDGKVVGLLYNEILSNCNNTYNTGNGFKSKYYDVSIPRMRNLRVNNGPNTVDDIMNSTKKGIYVKSVNCGDINIKTGEFSLLIDDAYLVKNGKKLHRIKNFTYYGNTLEIIKNINMIGNDYDYKIDKCNKKGQLITVGYGSPTIKTNMLNIMR